jgi:hypothetical protein
MRPTSESDRDARTDSPDDTVRNDPWATGPGHLTHDTHDDQTERFVPEQRDPQDHDGHLYASDTYAEPETTVLPADGAHQHDGRQGADEPTAVGVAHVDTADSDTDKADHAAAKADHARDEAEEAKAEAVAARHDETHDETHDGSRHEVSPAELDSTREEPAVVVEPVPEPVPVAVVEPVADGRHDGSGHLAAVPVTTDEAHDETHHETHDETPGDPSGELKPGDVPVAPVAGFFAADAVQGLRDRWREAQLGFVDDPRKAVDDVKALVSEAVDQFTAAVSTQRDELDAAAGEDTEQYRVAVQRYRAFFDRLLNL